MIKTVNIHNAINFLDNALKAILVDHVTGGTELSNSVYYCNTEIFNKCVLSFKSGETLTRFSCKRALIGKIVIELQDATGDCVHRYTEDFVLAKGLTDSWLSCWFVSRDGLQIEGACQARSDAESRLCDIDDVINNDPTTRLDIYENFTASVDEALKDYEWSSDFADPGTVTNEGCLC